MKTFTTTGILFILLFHMGGCKDTREEKYFTGEIEYRYTYESNVLNTDSLSKERPVKGIFRYDLANYQSRFLGKDTFTYYYSGNLNKALSQAGNSENYTCEDYGMVTDSVISWKLYPTGEKVLEQVCDILELQKKNSLVVYYVSRTEKIAPVTYQKHKAYNWDVYGEKSNGGLILKMEHRFKVFTIKGIATKLVNQENNFKAFEIDDNTFNQFCKGDK